MRAVIQRVTRASVRSGARVATIGRGLRVFVGLDDVDGEILAVSQFTLAGRIDKVGLLAPAVQGSLRPGAPPCQGRPIPPGLVHRGSGGATRPGA